MKTVKKYLSRLSLILAGCCLALLLAEGFVRIFYPYSRDHVIPGGLFEINNDLGWKLKAGKRAVHHSRDFDVVYKINILGYRDKPRKLSKEENIYRILLYGDSQVFGWGIPESQRFSNLIEDQRSSLEIWNLAVPGYGLDQEILSYEKDGRFLNADEVIFFVSESTLERIHYDYIYNKHKPKFVLDQNGILRIVPIPQRIHVWTSLLYKVLSPLYLPYFIERRLAMLKSIPERSRHTQNQETIPENLAISELEKGILNKAKEMALKQKHQLSFLVFLPEKSRENIQNFCKQREIGFLEIIFHSENQDLIISEYDRHWNFQAHKLIAQQLLFQLEARVKDVYKLH